MDTISSWQDMVNLGLKEDELRLNWKKRIDGGLKSVKKVQITFELKSGGFAISEYILPFEKDLMKDDVDTWTPICSKIVKNELKDSIVI